MAERRLRQNCRNSDEKLLKKRSRSEGPHERKKLRNSMHETTKSNQVKPATNGRHSMYTGVVSDDNDVVAGHSGSESPDSDMADQTWTRNPLMIRKSRKSDRSSKTDKRRSVHNVDKGEGSDKRGPNAPPKKDLFIFPRKSDSSGGQKSKFQRMEENRNKRIEMAVTSDEECSPQIRISRLRQRAMMSSNLGNNSNEGGMNIVPLRNDGSVNASEEFFNSTDQKRLSQYEESRRSKYDENFNFDQMNGNHFKSSSSHSRQPKLPQVLPEYLPQSRTAVNNSSGNRGDFDQMAKTVTNQNYNIPVQQGSSKQRESDILSLRRNSGGRVKMSSESPKLRNFNEVRTSQPTQLKKADQKIELIPRSPNSSSDSLDDLIESNIQYLESEIESGKLKRQSGNFSNTSTENVIQRQVIRQPLRPQPQNFDANDEFRSKIHDPRTYVSNKLMSTVTKVEPKVVQKSTVYAQPLSTYSHSPVQSRSERRNIPTSGSATYSPYMQRKQVEPELDISKSDSHLNDSDTQFTPSQHSFQVPKSYAPYPVLNKQTGNVIYVQPDSSIDEQVQMSENGFVPSVDTGMFSDVDYDIEVSERIKKWEKKLTPGEMEERHKVLNTIKEYESFSDSNAKDTLPDTPVEVRRELWQLISPTDNSGVGQLSVNLTQSASSISDSNVSERTHFKPKVVSSETNLHRVFRVVSEPKQKHSHPIKRTGHVEKVMAPKTPKFPNQFEQASGPFQPENQNQYEKHTTPRRQKVQSENSGYAQSLSNVTLSESEIGSNMQQSWPPMVDSDSGIRKSWRMSRYEEEINELKELVSDNFNDIRKRFDSDMSETDTKRASSPVSRAPHVAQPSTTSGTAKLTLNIQPVTPTVQRSPVSIRRKLSDQTPPASPISSVTPKPERRIPAHKNVPVEAKPAPVVPSSAPKQITITEVKPHLKPDPKQTPDIWSPNMESRQGLVSIERVKARTLQTIPFSDDPVWKDLEGLATFDKTEVGVDTAKEVNFDEIDELLKVATGGMDNLNLKSTSNFEQQMNRLTSSEYISPKMQPSNLMSQSYAADTSQLQPPVVKQRALSDPDCSPNRREPKPSSSYSFTAPTIQPLKLNSKPSKKSSTSALDEVLEDIRVSLQKKPLSPKLMKNLDTSEENSSTNLSLQSPLTKSSKAFVFPREPKKVVKELPLSATSAEPVKSLVATPGYDNTQSSWKPAHADVPPQLTGVGYIDPEFTQFPYIINGNYHLDPKLLSDKLKSTGLANDSSEEQAMKQKKAFTEQALNSIMTDNAMDQTNCVRSQSQSKRNVHELNQTKPNVYELNQSKPSVYELNQLKPNVYELNQSKPNVYDSNQVKTNVHEGNQSKPRVHELDQSVDDLRSLAQEVEFKLSQIKSRIVSADEKRLDSILLALRKFAPTTEQTYFNVKFTPNYESEKARRGKLEEALGELEKMYESLDLNNESLMDRASRREETLAFESNHPRKNSAKSSSTANIQLVNNSNAKPGGASKDTRILRKSQIDEIERQTQNEFEDITKSFQVLLDEVTKQCRSVAKGSSKYSESTTFSPTATSAPTYSSQRPRDEIWQEPPRHQLKFDTPSQRAVQDSYNTAIKELESVAMGMSVGQPESKPVQSVMYLNLDNPTQTSQKCYEFRHDDKALPAQRVDTQVQSANVAEQNVKPNVASSQYVSMATDFNKPVTASTVVRDSSGSESLGKLNQSSVALKVELNNEKQQSKGSGRFRKRSNIQHRKSMPAITRTVETQTVETQTENPSEVDSDKAFEQFRKASLKDMLGDTASGFDRQFPRKLSSSRLADLNSSEDECRKSSKMRHSLSAPDIVAMLMDYEQKEKFDQKGDKIEFKVDKMAARATPKTGTPKSMKQRHEKARFRSLKDETMVRHVDTTTSISHEESVESPTSKPPVYPVWKYPGQGDGPMVKKGEKTKSPFVTDHDFTRTTSDTEQNRSDDSIVRRRTRSFGGEAEPEERPRSFHELVATFEQDPKRLEKIRLSGLRKCASEDSMFTDLILQKIYHSESDLSSTKMTSSSASKLELEMKIIS